MTSIMVLNVGHYVRWTRIRSMLQSSGLRTGENWIDKRTSANFLNEPDTKLSILAIVREKRYPELRHHEKYHTRNCTGKQEK